MENIFHHIAFHLKLLNSRYGQPARHLMNVLLVLTSFAVIILMLIQLGYDLQPSTILIFTRIYNFGLIVLSVIGLINLVFNNGKIGDMNLMMRIDFFFHAFMCVLVFLFFMIGSENMGNIPIIQYVIEWKLLYIFLFLMSVFQLSWAILSFLNSRFQPARIFAGSFFVFVLIGSWLLMLPHCLKHPISYIDALFTATSSVCITGLTVLNIYETFTPTGLFIMLILIQIGGLGVLTFTTLFGLLAMGKTSISTDVIIKDMFNQNNFNDIFKLMRLIFLTTFTLEFIGAVFLYETVGDSQTFPFRRAVFHSVSAFCNAGFSTLPDGLNTPLVKYNWGFLFVISLLVILGSIGFPIVNNLRYGLFHVLQNLFMKIGFKRPYKHKANLFTLNTKIAVWMTLALLASGTIFFYITEYNGILKDLSWQGKITTSFFMSMTPRSGGFNCYPMAAMTQFGVLMTMFLMWVGGGPLSTGGGIKTTTFGLTVMSIWSIMRGRDYVDIYHSRINPVSILRASALVFISMLLTALGTLLITFFDPHLPFRNIVYEVLSAISTCGLSMDTTPLLSTGSKLVIIMFMYFGRVGLLIILESLVKNSNAKDYRYPTDYVAVG